MLLSTTILLFFLSVTYALFVILTRKSDARHAQLEHRVAEALQESLESSDEQVRLFREDTISRNPLINRLLSSVDFVNKLDRMLSQADVRITVSRLLMFCVIAGVLATLAAMTVFSSLVGVLALGLVAAVAPIVQVSWKRKRRLRKFNEHLPDTLDLMSRSLSAGHAFSEALHQVATEMPDPISTEFRIAFEEQKLGLSTKLALQRLCERVPILDLRLCVTGILIQRETGGNLAELLEKVSTTIRERFKVMEDFRTMTTSARGSAWILCALPVATVLMMSLINPEYMSILLNDSRGHLVLAGACVLQIMGMLLIRKIVNIKI